MLDMNELRTEGADMTEEAKLRAAKRVLETALGHVNKKLGYEEKKVREDRPAEFILKTLEWIIRIVLILTAVLAVLEFFKNRKEEKEAAAENDRLDMYRRMSGIKGRV